MTAERAVKLANLVALSVLAGGPYPDATLHARIANQVAELLVNTDWRVLPEDPREEKPELFATEQLELL